MTTLTGTGTLSGRLLEPRRRKLEALTGQPFVQALAGGTISDGTMAQWAQADIHYLWLKLRALHKLLSRDPGEPLAGVLRYLAGDCRLAPGVRRDLLGDLGVTPAPRPIVTCSLYGAYLAGCADDLLSGTVAVLFAEEAHLVVSEYLRSRIEPRSKWYYLAGTWPGESATVAGLRACVDAFGVPPADMLARAGEVADTILECESRLWLAIWNGEGWPV